MPSQPARLSKSRYVSGLQCHKQLWWRVHEPEAPELAPSPGQQNLFAQGHDVGERARQHVPGGGLMELPFSHQTNLVAPTREPLNHAAPAIYEPGFLPDDTNTGFDILDRRPRAYAGVEGRAP